MIPRPTPAQAVAAAALVLAITSRGELAVLGLLLLAPDLLSVEGRRTLPWPAIAVVGALGASSWRWGTTSLEALAGVQAVLGPAGGIGPTAGATGSWLGAVALVLALGRGADPVRLAAAGATAAALLAGPAPGGQVPVRIAVAVGAAAAGAALGWWRTERPGLDRALALLAAACGVGAVVAVALGDAGGSPTLPWGLVGQGAVIAVAVVAIGIVAGSPTVRSPLPALSATSRPR